jgi:hypothetical protein
MKIMRMEVIWSYSDGPSPLRTAINDLPLIDKDFYEWLTN